MSASNTAHASASCPAFLCSSASPYCGNGSLGRCAMNAFKSSMRDGGTKSSDRVQAALRTGHFVVDAGQDAVRRVDVNDDGAPGTRLGLVGRLGKRREDDDVPGPSVMSR